MILWLKISMYPMTEILNRQWQRYGDKWNVLIKIRIRIEIRNKK